MIVLLLPVAGQALGAAVEHGGCAAQELDELTRANQQLKLRVDALRDPGALEHEARKLGMVRQGERAYVIEGLPR